MSILLQGKCEGGLYPLPLASFPLRKNAWSSVKVPQDVWHCRLDHPSPSIIQRVLQNNNLPFSTNNCDIFVCNACQQEKCHQLPFSLSTSVSSTPLQLVFSDVWGPAITSIGGYNYYISFIDDFNKFTWIYPLKYKSDVFSIFLRFQKHVERLLNTKIVSFQLDWGGEYHKLNKYFQENGVKYLVSCPHTHQQNESAERKHRHIV